MSTIIRLIEGSKGYLETDSTTKIPLTISISDIKDLSKRKGTFSKSVVLPGSKNNNLVLNNYYDVNVMAGNFDINKVVKCSIVQDGIVILDNAVFQLISADITNNTYTVLIKDLASDFYSTIANKKLEDLDFSWMNHIYNATNVVASYDNTLQDGYKYIVPFNPMSVDDVKFNLREFNPGIYLRHYLNKIFSDAGYSYNWIGANDDDIRLDKLIIPYNGDGKLKSETLVPIYNVEATKIASHKLENLYFYTPATENISQLYRLRSIPKGPAFLLNNFTQIIDDSNIFDATTGVYSSPPIPSDTNRTKFSFNLDFSILLKNKSDVNDMILKSRFLPDDILNITNLPLRFDPYIYLYQTIGGEDVVISKINFLGVDNDLKLYEGFTIVKNTTHNLITSNVTFEGYIEGIDFNQDIKIGKRLDLTVPGATEGTELDGRPYYVFERAGGIATFDVEIGFTVSNINMKINTLVSEYGYNTNVNMNEMIPRNIKQSDFLKGIFILFNLYADVDKDIANQINIYRRDSFYDNGKNVDWTNKLAKNKDQVINFLPDLVNRKILLTYKQDGDWANKRYQEESGEIFGQAEYTFDNENMTGVSKVESLFSPTPMMNTSFGAITPIWEGGQPKTNIRLLYDAGVKNCGSYTIWNYMSNSNNPNAFITINKYPLISTWDSEKNPTFDLNFLPPDFQFRTDEFGENTENNLYNLHWRRTMNQINTGRMLSAYFNLNSDDIMRMRMSDKIRIDNSWWNISSIKDYDANANELTKVDLISIDEALKINYLTKSSNGLLKSSPLLSGFNQMSMNQIRTRNKILSLDLIYVSGFNNTVTNNSNGSVIIGDNNNVDNNTLVIGNNNNVPDNINGSIIVGNNINATQSNTLYTDNIYISEGGTINNIDINNIINGGGGTFSGQAVSATQSGIVNNVYLQELGGVDKLINGIRIGRGNNNIYGNVAFGKDTLSSITTGEYNLCIGDGAGDKITTGFQNTYIGNNSGMSSVNSQYNTAIGQSSMSGITNSIGRSVAIGVYSMYEATGTDKNVAIGVYSLRRCTTGFSNVGIGYDTLQSLTSGNGNVAVGQYSAGLLTTGQNNNCIGKFAGDYLTTGSYNTIIGSSGIGSGSNNIVIGRSTGLTTGSNNVVIGNPGTVSNIDNAIYISDGVGQITIQKDNNNLLTAPTQTKDLINSDTTGKAIIIKEYLESTIISSDDVFSVNSDSQVTKYFCSGSFSISAALTDATLNKGKTIIFTSTNGMSIQIVSNNPSIPQVQYKNVTTVDKSGYYTVTIISNGTKWFVTNFINM